VCKGCLFLRINKWITALAVIFLLLTGCSNKTVEPVKEHKEKKVENVKKDPPKFSAYYPLTGIGTNENINNRAIAVMVNNHPKARPQSGLNKADIVYELLAEGNVTRFLAIFQSEKPENIGPVRSAREYYIELAKGYDGLFIAHGYSPDAKEKLDRGEIDHLNGMQYDGTLFKRSSDRIAPHNSYITYDKILEGAKKNNYSMEHPPSPIPFLTEAQQAELTGTPATNVTVPYLNDSTFTAIYEYDAAIGKYTRSSDGEQTIDLNSKEPILLDNVFIVETDHQTIDSAGRRQIDLTSGGNAYLIQKGKLREVQWTNDNGRILPVIDGEVGGFVPGKTWINIIPSNPGLAAIKVN
jgi:hypothetical protein